jgi:hypothetical protein
MCRKVQRMARGVKTVKATKSDEAVARKQENPGIVEEINEGNIDEIEKKTIEKVLGAVSTLESSLAVWDGAKEKPKIMAARFEGYRRLHDALTRWLSGAVKAGKGGSKESFEARLQRLREFADICYSA